MEITKRKLQKIFENVTRKKQIHEAVLFVENSTGDVNQMANPAIPVRLVMQLAMSMK